MKNYCESGVFLFAVVLMIVGGCSERDVPGVETEEIQGITMISIPAGSFMMGYDYVYDPEVDEKVNKYFPDEQPVHTVTISAFQIGATEITQGQYKAVVGENSSTFTGDDNLPVTNVSADDALKFCNMISEAAGFEPCYDEKTGKCDFSKNGFRLPTEAEWEYACRAGTQTHFNTGNKESDLDRAGWYLGNSDGKTHPVARKEPNAWGFYDMHGNVFEYCYDGYEEAALSWKSPSESVPNPRGAEIFPSRVMRGGGWFSEPFACRSATRSRFWTGGGNYYTGFRIARSLK